MPMPSVDKKKIEMICRQWGISEMAFFGSAIRKDFGPDSDVDILISFFPEAEPSLFDMVRLQSELENLLERKVDLASRRAIESSRNPLRREEILNSAEVFYEA